ncbi:MAG: hypothetical protein Q8Q67_02610 [bacterium]|nr:hypothetical protein [bacterium]
MGATRHLKNYTQEACTRALGEGFSVGVPGAIRPDTDQITMPHRVQEVKENDQIIGYNIDALYLPQSDEWDRYVEMIKQSPGQRLAGFPFSVIWPRMYSGKKYQIITVAGEMLLATVDDSREFMSEGLEWKTKTGNKSKNVVAAWKEYWQR